MIAHIEPGPNTAYLEQGFSTGDPGPDIRFQWILTRLLAIDKRLFFKSISYFIIIIIVNVLNKLMPLVLTVL